MPRAVDCSLEKGRVDGAGELQLVGRTSNMSQPKRRDEEFAREAVTRFLCPPFLRSELGWNAHEAPDWILNLGSEVLGVEVTWVTGTTEVDGKTVLNRELSASLSQWAEALSLEIEAEPWFSGLYILSMEPIPDLRRQSQHIREHVFAYAKETHQVAEAPPRRLPGGWNIGKHRGSTNQLSYCYSVGSGGREGDIKIEAARLIADAVGRKNSLVRSSRMPVALALVDDYHFAALETWREVAQATGPTKAHCLFRVHGEYECDLLAGEDLRELKVPANPAAEPGGCAAG